MLNLSAHPIGLIISAVFCIPILFPLSRFFFDDLASFKAQFGLSRDWEKSLWLLGFVPSSPIAYAKKIGFLGSFIIVVFAMHFLLVELWQLLVSHD